MKVTVLGSGTSSGVPLIGCRCETCVSSDPKDDRTRTSIWLRSGQDSVIIDTSSDFRVQCLREKITAISAVVYTHQHYDHISGFDDLRAYNFLQKQKIPVYMTTETAAYMKIVFGYAFNPDPANQSSRPMIETRLFDTEKFSVGSMQFQPLDLWHGTMAVKGFRIGSFAYCTDCNAIPDQTVDMLAGLDLLILDGLRPTVHPTHFTFDQAVEMARRIGARMTYLTHISHDITHQVLSAMLPQNVKPAYDGLTLDVNGLW